MTSRWWKPWRHPAPELLSGYADKSLPDVQAEKVRLHVASCVRCRTELELHDEAMKWLSTALPEYESNALAAIRERLIAEVRAPRPFEAAAGACARECLGPWSFTEMARRLRRCRGGVPPAAKVAGPMLSSFVGRKALAGN